MGGPPRCYCDITCICRSLVRIRITAAHAEVELDYGRGEARSRPGCLPSESSGAKVQAQPKVTAVLNCELRVIARHTFAVIEPFITGKMKGTKVLTLGAGR